MIEILKELQLYSFTKKGYGFFDFERNNEEKFDVLFQLSERDLYSTA